MFTTPFQIPESLHNNMINMTSCTMPRIRPINVEMLLQDDVKYSGIMVLNADADKKKLASDCLHMQELPHGQSSTHIWVRFDCHEIDDVWILDKQIKTLSILNPTTTNELQSHPM